MKRPRAASIFGAGRATGCLAALVLAGAVLVLPGQAAAQFGLNTLFNRLQDDSAGNKDEPAAEADAPAGLQSAFGNDVALVESIDNAAGADVAFLDTVQAGRVIELDDRGVLVLSYFGSCVRETITGGRVVVGEASSSVSGGELTSEIVDCQGATPVITAELSEAGTAVKRVTPFDPDDWKEWAVRTPHPIFKWQAGADGAPATVTVVYLDSAKLRIVWQGQTADAHMVYPEDALPLETGMPYLVQVDRAGEASLTTVFSVDPWLDVADNAANRIVPIGR